MLVLSRKINQSIMIGDNIRVVIVGVDRDQVKVGIEAPRDIPVHRSEVFEEIQRANRVAAGSGPAQAAGTPRAAVLGKAVLTPRPGRPPRRDPASPPKPKP